MSVITRGKTPSQHVMRSVLRPKPWHFELLQSEALYRLLDGTLSALGAAALVLPGGQAVHICPLGPTDCAALPQAAALCMQYLQLKDGDAALMNDPLSGGTLLSEVTLVLGVTLDPEPGEPGGGELLLARRLSLSTRIGDKDHLDQQGVRIPPTPLTQQKGQLNTDLLSAISLHPLAPRGLSEKIQNAFFEMKEVAGELKNLARDPGSEFKRAHLKRYLSDSSRTFQNLMSRLPLGTAVVSTQLSTGESIKLKLEVNEQHLHFDFAGTDASSQVSLTETACFGACIAATAMTIAHPIPFNAGSFEHIHVSTPAKTLLSGRASEGLFSGMTSGVAILCELVQSAFTKLNPLLKAAAQTGADGHYEIRFQRGSFSGRIRHGCNAHKDSRGLDAFGPWSSQNQLAPSAEDSEREWPLQINFSGLQPGSGGKGRHPGGDGALQVVTVNEPAELRWSMGQPAQRAEGSDTGRAGSAAQIQILRATDSRRETFEMVQGKIELFTGDQIHIAGAGGSGFGETPTKAAESL